MNSKEYQLTPDIIVRIVKRKKSRRIKITLEPNGGVRVSIPYYVPYQMGVSFAKSKIDWINERRIIPKSISDFEQVGKSHRLEFLEGKGDRVTTKVIDQIIKIFIPTNLDHSHPQVQEAAKKASKKALSKEAIILIPQRVEYLANKNNFDYSSVNVKFTKSRWGSCDNKKNLIFNPNLMNLPWDLIDYVIIHELSHTKAMHHGSEFWDEVQKVIPNYKEQRKRLKEIRDNL